MAFFSFYSLIVAPHEKTDKTAKKVFYHIFKHFEARQKLSAVIVFQRPSRY